MPVPKKRVSRTRRDKRRTHKSLTAVNLTKCSQCNEPVIPHRVCPSCGFYKDRTVIEVEE
ncbi:MAG: 50S ribosomal protein L32 [Thermodesulfobacteriota bacterium]